jgi:hypothetical protein
MNLSKLNAMVTKRKITKLSLDTDENDVFIKITLNFERKWIYIYNKWK